MARRDLDTDKKLEQWAETVINDWIVKMQILGMSSSENSGELIRGLIHHIEWSEPNEDQVEYLRKVQFAFKLYGKFVDYGLGRGTDMIQRFERGNDSKSNPRKRKRWILEPWEDALQIVAPIIGGLVASQIIKRLTREFHKEDDS